jgi:glycosyltransferase involved in cell wall biosynthesis
VRIWLVKFDETLPVDSNPRLYRMGMLAEALLAAGHEVVWWASTFDHSSGRLRFAVDTVCAVRPGYELRLLHTVSGYARAVSGARVINNLRQALRFRACADTAPRPDLIVCAMPTPELAWISAGLGARYRVPVVIDARDMWPDIFAELLSPVMRVAAWPYVTLMRAMLRSAVRRAAGCTGITEPFLDWILGYSGRSRRPADAVFPLGYQEPVVAAADLQAAGAMLPEGPAGVFIVIFLGRLNRTVLDAFDPVVMAARNLRGGARPFRFYFAGTGDCAEALKVRAADCPEIVFFGQVGPPVMAALKQRAHAALLCIARRKDYQISLSNKVFDYISAGLPLVSHLTGLVGDLVATEECGLVYDDGNGLTAALRLLSRDESLRQRMGRKAKRVFEDRYNVSRVYPAMAAHLARVAAPDLPRAAS